MGTGDTPDLWSHPRLSAAAREGDWGAVLRTYRSLTGLSQTRIGERTGLAQPDVSAIERGRRAVTSAEVRQRIAAGLGMPNALLAGPDGPSSASSPPVASLALGGTAPDADLLERITGTVREGRRVDAPTLDWLDRLLAEHRRAEDTIGSRPLMSVMSQQLSTVVDLHAGARGPLGRRVVRLAAEHAQFMAWMTHDQDNTAAALAWYDRSHEWALEAGDPGLAATTLSMKAHMAWSKHRPGRCVRLAEAARWSAPGASPGVQGMAAQMAARGHALGGDASAAHRLLDEAQELIGRAARRPEDEPPWMYFYDETWSTLQRGMADMHLGDWPRAIDRLTTGLTGLPAGYRRDRAWYRSCLADCLARQGETAAALDLAVATAPDADAVGRPYSWQHLHTTAATLLRRRAPEGRALLAVLKEYGDP
ncbi:helix-turn-helix domain-containing protein [Streptomyces xiamenensis]|uniref:helix-turn-helix domain-containing protein n=1 Tax=Streptomyces xiamenensis TaxID=408015 RepID=UPI0036E9B084